MRECEIGKDRPPPRLLPEAVGVNKNYRESPTLITEEKRQNFVTRTF